MKSRTWHIVMAWILWTVVVIVGLYVLVGVLFVLPGCRSCTYQGKAIPTSEADYLRQIGMDVQCSDD